MSFPLPSVEGLTGQICRALLNSEKLDAPFNVWGMKNVLPERVLLHILGLPVPPAILSGSDRMRNKYNQDRWFVTPERRKKFLVLELLAQSFQTPKTAKTFADMFGVKSNKSFVRIEYVQDLDGAWLEPHCDIPEKMATMLIYLGMGPSSKDWGTDLYDHNKKHIGRAPSDFNSACVFIAGENTWHGFEPRHIDGVRRVLIVNYVDQTWRDKDQLCFPETPVSF